MISLSNGHVQGPNNLAVPNGSVTFTLSQDANVVATPFGLVLAQLTVRFQFDNAGQLAGSPQIWSNQELSPAGTYYLVNFYDANGARLNAIPIQWTFTQTDGENADIGQMAA